MLVANLYAGVVVYPRARDLRPLIKVESVPQNLKDEFHRQHRLAVQLNAGVLLGALGLSVLAGLRFRP